MNLRVFSRQCGCEGERWRTKKKRRRATEERLVGRGLYWFLMMINATNDEDGVYLLNTTTYRVFLSAIAWQSMMIMVLISKMWLHFSGLTLALTLGG